MQRSETPVEDMVPSTTRSQQASRSCTKLSASSPTFPQTRAWLCLPLWIGYTDIGFVLLRIKLVASSTQAH